MYNLECEFDARKSFYKKAKVEVQKDNFECTKYLYSYGVLVSSVVFNYKKNIIAYKYFGKYSQTTTRHQKEFFKQEGLNEKELKELFEMGELTKEVE